MGPLTLPFQTRALLLDAEGVVIDTEGTWDVVQTMILATRGRTYQRDALKHLLTGLAGEDAVRLLIEHYGLADDPLSLLEERRALMTHLVADTVNFVVGFPEFYAVASDQCVCALVTSMDPSLLADADRRLDLTRLFQNRIFTVDQVGGRGKPHPDLFLHAAACLGLAASDCLVVEDAPNGIAAARSAGMACVGLCSTHDSQALAHADVLASDWREMWHLCGLTA